MSSPANAVFETAGLSDLSFADLGVPPALAAALAARGIDAPFPIQAATIPDALDGRDVCGRAPTGSGKTIAFGIPLVLGIGKAKPRRPRGLVLVPTRELAAQVCHELQLLAKPKGPWVEVFYGGVGFDRQTKALKRGVDIAVACPGRLADLVRQGEADLSDVDFVVVDEADRMADMGFLPEVRRLLDQCSSKRQTLLFSATLDGDVDVLISKYQHDPVRHEHVADDEDDARAEHYFWAVERQDRARTVADVIKHVGPTVVFCRTKRGADRVARTLETNGVRAAAIHGDRSQAQRDRALAAFHEGRVTALVATDVAARGIHVEGVACVLHFDPPGDAKDYVHRSGRTARAGASGVVVSFVPGDLKRDVSKMQKELGHPVGLDRPAPLTLAAGSDAPATHRPASTHVSSPERPAHTARSSSKPRPSSKPRNSAKPRPSSKQRPSSKPRPSAKTGSSSASRSSSSSKQARSDDGIAEVERISDHVGSRTSAPARAPLAPGQRRPSGAARRKAKKLAALEAGIEIPSGRKKRRR